MHPSRNHLLTAAQQFCDAFSTHQPLPILLSHFSATHQASVFEHGEPHLAPFLGRRFAGLSGVEEYFTLIASLLSYEDMHFSEFVIDTEARKAAMKGQARFTWLSTGESWDETFAYILDFDEDAKVAEYQIWADSGAAYLAGKGQLDEARKAGMANEVLIE
ncbi:hypothetical protein Hypma_012407 [Hypsizygus marmoreus]|uniref:Transcription elongation factor S-II n=1 Tax=Hypsizygus marmoreus TaxID=39966 RepID=A0A369JF19_HYPMA|nr:hypothetical protein Hypma_012407 [Hypsizygus marmoreus]